MTRRWRLNRKSLKSRRKNSQVQSKLKMKFPLNPNKREKMTRI
jgi:hypothetical protein